MQEPKNDQHETVDGEKAQSSLAYIRSALNHFGVPECSSADDQFDNFVDMYRRRGTVVTCLTEENRYLHERIACLEEVLVTVANWPNPGRNSQTQAMKIWAASVLDPSKVDMLKSLTQP